MTKYNTIKMNTKNPTNILTYNHSHYHNYRFWIDMKKPSFLLLLLLNIFYFTCASTTTTSSSSSSGHYIHSNNPSLVTYQSSTQNHSSDNNVNNDEHKTRIFSSSSSSDDDDDDENNDNDNNNNNNEQIEEDIDRDTTPNYINENESNFNIENDVLENDSTITFTTTEEPQQVVQDNPPQNHNDVMIVKEEEPQSQTPKLIDPSSSYSNRIESNTASSSGSSLQGGIEQEQPSSEYTVDNSTSEDDATTRIEQEQPSSQYTSDNSATEDETTTTRIKKEQPSSEYTSDNSATEDDTTATTFHKQMQRPTKVPTTNTTTKSSSSTSQPLRTLQKLQAMLEDTDYATMKPTSTSSSSSSSSNRVYSKQQHQQNQQNDENFFSSYMDDDEYNTRDEYYFDTNDDDSIIDDDVDDDDMEEEVKVNKLWQSKDRSKYRKQQRKIYHQQRMIQQQKEEELRKRQFALQQENPRIMQMQTLNQNMNPQQQIQQQQKQQQQPNSFSDDEMTGGSTDGNDDTDDGLSYTLPNLPVYFSDAESADEFDADIMSSSNNLPSSSTITYSSSSSSTQSPGTNVNTSVQPSILQQDLLITPSSTTVDQSLRQQQSFNGRNVMYSTDQQQTNKPQYLPQQGQGPFYQYQYPYVQQQQQQRGNTHAQGPNLYPYFQQQQQQQQASQYYNTYPYQYQYNNQNSYNTMNPPNQQLPPPPHLMPQYTSWNNPYNGYPSMTHPTYPGQQGHLQPQQGQQQRMSNGLSFIPHTHMTPAPIHNMNNANPQYSSTMPTDNNFDENMRNSDTTHHITDDNIVSIATTKTSPMPNTTTTAVHQQSSTGSSDRAMTLAEASTMITFDSIQKIFFICISVILLSYCAVSPRSLPAVEYNNMFNQNVRIVALSFIGPIITFLSVLDAKDNDVNALVNTFYTSFSVGYILAFLLELVFTTLIRLGVFAIWEPGIFSLTPRVPLLVLPWTLRDHKYRPKRITLFAADFATSCIAAPIIEEFVKLKAMQLSARLPKNFRLKVVTNSSNSKSSSSTSDKKKKKKVKKRIREQVFRGPGEPEVTTINNYVTHMLAASLGIKTFDTTRRILMYTKRDDHHKSFYSILRGFFPIQELCGVMTSLELAKRDVLGVDVPYWRMLLPAVFIHGMANFRGMKPLFKWNSSTPWSEMQISPWNSADDSTLSQLFTKSFSKIMWLVILCRVLGYCVKNYYLIGRLAVKRTTTYAGKFSAYSAEMRTAEMLKKSKKD